MSLLSNLDSDRFGLKTIFHAVMGIVILIVGSLLASLSTGLFFSAAMSESSPWASVVMAILNIAVLLLLICFYITKVLKMSLSSFRIQKPKTIVVWILCAIVLPLSVSAFFIFLTPGIFEVTEANSGHIAMFVTNAVFLTCLTAGITEELIFRGFIMHLLEKRWNKQVAIIAPSVMFGALHIFNMENPSVADVLLLLAAGTFVGIMFSMIAYQSGSIWPGAFVHGIWNLIIIGGILEISFEPTAIFNYTLQSDSTILTGGAFGVESSLPAVIGYVAVIILVLILQRRSPQID